MTTSENAVVLYQSPDGSNSLEVRLDQETVWLTQKQMAELFQRERSVITKHLRNVFIEGELDEKSNVQNMHFAFSDKPVALYNLDVIISVGYFFCRRPKTKKSTNVKTKVDNRPANF